MFVRALTGKGGSVCGRLAIGKMYKYFFFVSPFWRGVGRSFKDTIKNGMALSPAGGVFSYLPHYLDLASEDSVGHSTCMSVLARRKAIMGSIVQPKRSCLGAATGTAESPRRWGKSHTYPTAKNPPTTP